MAAKRQGAGIRHIDDVAPEASGLTKRYGSEQALEVANFVLRKGEHVAVAGDNGAGKSTFVCKITTVDQKSAKRMRFDGRKMAKLWLDPFSILDRKVMRKRTLEALKTTAVKISKVDNPIRNMSGGQRQCVSIARTAAFASKLVIMDEPTAALCVQETAQVENIIRRLKEREVPLILISHNLRRVFDLFDRINASLHSHETNGKDIVGCTAGVKGADGT